MKKYEARWWCHDRDDDEQSDSQNQCVWCFHERLNYE